MFNFIVQLDNITIPPNRLRGAINEDVVTGLMESIKAVGLLSPIVIKTDQDQEVGDVHISW